jgi:hypothetical protein
MSLRLEQYYDEVEQRVFEQLKVSADSLYLVRQAITRDTDPYMNIKISKGGQGKTRIISAPFIELSKIQKTILEELEKVVQSPPHGKPLIQTSAHAYRKRRSHTTAAAVHLGMKWGVKVDLQRFYDHITEEHVYRALKKAGVGESAYFWTKLCTRVPANWPEGLPAKYRRYQRTLFRPIPNFIYDIRDRWFTELLPNQIMAQRVRRSSSNSKVTLSRFFRVLPPKRIQRIIPALLSGKIPTPDLSGLEVELLFDRVKNLFKGEADPKKAAEFNRIIKLSRKRWREHLIDLYEDPLSFEFMTGDTRQKHYAVRPEQYRMRTKIGYLPQGSPVSGLISNMVMSEFDTVMYEFCSSNNLRYTRYSDDIVVSSTEGNFSRERSLKIISFIQKLSEFNGFSLNKEKTRILTPGSRKYVLGVLVDGENLRLGKHERENIEKAIYQIAKFGDFWSDKEPSTHLLNYSHTLPGKRLGSYSNPRTPSDPLSSLLGWLSYCKAADMEFLKKIDDQLKANKWEFTNPLQFAVISTHTSKLLKLKPKLPKAQGDLGVNKPVGPHWNSPLTDRNSGENEDL